MILESANRKLGVVIMHENKDIVQYINEVNVGLSEGTEESSIVTELQMHKMLFLIYGRFYNHYNIELWQPNFEAWKYGPVETNYRHNLELVKPIDIDQLSIDQKNQLKKMIIKLLGFSVWELVDYTHTLDSWKNHYEKKDKVISAKEIQDEFARIFF